MTQTLSAAGTAAAMKLYDKGRLRDLVNMATDGILELYNGFCDAEKIGNDGLQWPVRMSLPGDFGPSGEGNTLIGLDTSTAANEETQHKTRYNYLVTKRNYYNGVISISDQAADVGSDPGKSVINLLQKEITGAAEMVGAQTNYDIHFGTNGWLVKCSDTDPTVVTANTLWKIPISTDVESGSYRFTQNAAALKPGTYIEAFVIADNLVKTDGTNKYRGIIYAVDPLGQFVYVQWDEDMASTASDLTSLNGLRRRKRGLSTRFKYGIPDFCGDINSTYFKDDGSETATNAYPSGNGETGIDPDTDPLWQALVVNSAASQIKQKDLDKAKRVYKDRWGITTSKRMAYLTGPEVAEVLIQEQRNQREYLPASKNDQQAAGYEVYIDGTRLHESTLMPRQVLYMLDTEVLSMDDDQKKGMRWITVTDPGTGKSGIFLLHNTKAQYQAQYKCYGNYWSKNRSHLRLQAA